MQRYKGIVYPIEKTVKGLMVSSGDVAQIKGNMVSIIMTKPGERVFEPHFGTPLHSLPNKPDELLIEDIRQMIAHSLKRWEQRVQVDDIQVVLLPGGDMNIKILFLDPANLQKMHQLTLQIPLGGV